MGPCQSCQTAADSSKMKLNQDTASERRYSAVVREINQLLTAKPTSSIKIDNQ